MRTVFFFLFCSCIFLATSCGNDDDNAVSVTMENIQGTWNLTAMASDADITISDGSLTDRSSITSSISNSTITITFNADGTWSSVGTCDITVTDSDGTETTELTDGVGNGTYTVANGTVTIVGIDAEDETDVEEPVPYSVVAFEPGSRLILDGSAMESIDFFGATFSIDLEQRMTLEQ